MGNVHGSLKSALTSQRGYLQCVPRQCYQPFPEQLHSQGEGGLVLQLQALPPSLGKVFKGDPMQTHRLP